MTKTDSLIPIYKSLFLMRLFSIDNNLRFPLIFCFMISIVGCATSPNSKEKVPDSRPNMIYILADDLGYGELGCYGQQIIQTPNIDALARAGMKFTQHYTGAPVCAPARCILLTGQHNGHAYIRGNDEMGSRGDVWSWEAMFQDSSLEGQRPIPDSIFTLAEALKEGGYRTGMVGKWGLGYPGSEGTPNRQGFDLFCGYNCQRQAHTYYPRHLWMNDQRIMLNNKNVPIHTRLDSSADIHDSKNYADFALTDYAPDIMHDAALRFIEESKEEPFFLYYASPIPHLPLQAPQKWVDHYRTIIGDETPYDGSKGYFPCQYPRATYAAMISYLDEQVGELVEKLKDEGIYDNTLIIFTSDNGPTYTGGADTEYFRSAYPFITANGRGKGYLYEGGIRVPMIACWPSRIQARSATSHASTFTDVFPTLCEIANIPTPNHLDGISFAASLLNTGIQTSHEYLYWEFPEYKGQLAIRIGNWKGLITNLHEGNTTFELFDIRYDYKEQKNVADEHPDIIEQMREIIKKEHRQSDIQRFRIAALGDEMEETE
jgi:arylsulfatase